MDNYKEKMNEVKNEVKNAANSIATEENKQKISNAADTVVKKAKGVNKKVWAIAAVAVVVLIAVISSFGGTIDKSIKEEVEQVVYQSSGYEAKNLKLVGKYEYPDSIFEEEADYYISGRYEGKGDKDGYYFLCIVLRASDGKEENLSFSLAGEYENKSELKDQIDTLTFLK